MKDLHPSEYLLAGKNLSIDAGAGTGKTTILVNTVTSLFLNDLSLTPEKVLLLTFTEKAATEMKVRLFSLWHTLHASLRSEDKEVEEIFGAHPGIIPLHPPLSENRQLLLHRISELTEYSGKLQISTIHSFCLSLLKEFPLETGVDPGFEIVEPFENSTLFDDAFARFIQEELGKAPLSPFWENFFDLFSNLELGRDFLRKFFHIICVTSRDLFTLGLIEDSRKEDIPLSPFLEKFHLPLYRILLRYLTESTPDGPEMSKAFSVVAGETEDIIALLQEGNIPYPPQSDHFLSSLRKLDGRKLRSGKRYPLNEELFSIDTLERGKIHRIPWKGSLGNIKKRIEKSLKMGEQIRRGALIEADLLKKARTMLRLFQEEKKGKLDFMDLLIKSVNLLQQKKHIRETLKKRFSYLLIDEFQDTDPIQALLCGFLSEKKGNFAIPLPEVELEGGKLFIVGDPRQSIYRFRRADPQIYSTMMQIILSGGGEKKALTHNYRSRSPLVSFFNDFFPTLFQEESDYSFPYGKALHPERGHGSGVCAVRAYSLLSKEGREDFLADLLLKIRDSGISLCEGEKKREVEWKDIAILYRADLGREVLGPVKEAFLRAKIPLIVPSLKGFYERQEVQDLLLLLEVLCDRENRTALYGVLKSPFFGFSDSDLVPHFATGNPPGKELDHALQTIREWESLRDTEGVHTIIEGLLRETGYEYTSLLSTGGERGFYNIQKILTIAKEFDRRYGGSLRSFASFLRKQISVTADEGEIPYFEEGENAVKMVTVHGAKGLEFPVVIYYLTGEYINKRVGPVLYDRVRGKMAIQMDNYSTPSCFELLSRKYRREKSWKEEQIPFLALEVHKAEAEELRLSYVAMTRARDYLFIVSSPPEKKSMERPHLWKALESYLLPHTPRPAQCEITGSEGEIRSPREGITIFSAQITPSKREKDQSLTEDRHPLFPSFSPSPLPARPMSPPLPASGIVKEEEGNLFGKRVHSILEIFPPFDGSLFTKGTLVGKTHFSHPSERDRFAEIIKKIKKSPLLTRFEGWQILGTEVPMISHRGEREVVEAADIALTDGKVIVVIDYKTGRRSPAKDREYKEQVQKYVGALSRGTGITTKGLVWYIEIDEWIPGIGFSRGSMES